MRVKSVISRKATVAVLVLAAPGISAGQPAPPSMPIFDPQHLSPDVAPCEDFYQHACGGWLAANPRPVDESYWSRSWTSYRRMLDAYLRELIESAADTSKERGRDEQLVGDLFASCMDIDGIEARGLRPLLPEKSLIEGMRSIEELPLVLGELTGRSSLDDFDGILFVLHAHGDPVLGGQAKRIWVEVGGDLGLSSQQDYISAEPRRAELRSAYRDHIATVMKQLGQETRTLERAAAVLALEIELAKPRLPASVTRNDADAIHNLFTVERLLELTPHFDWTAFMGGAGIGSVAAINVVEPDYLRRLDSLLVEVPLETWKDFLLWQVVASRAELLTTELREVHFDFFERRMRARESHYPRWRTCVQAVDRAVPFALSRIYIEQAFAPEIAETTREVFEAIQRAMVARVQSAEWMSEETKRRALSKLGAVRLSSGHPTVWPDDSTVTMRRDDFYGNMVRAFSSDRRVRFAGLGRPVDINQWNRPPTWIGGYYSNELNAIFMTAAQLLLLAGSEQDPAVLYGGLGVFLGHELSHGFDPLGRRYDEKGRLRDWWAAGEAELFAERSDCVAEHFSTHAYLPGIPIDGALVVSEQTAELTGWSLAWEAFVSAVSKQALTEAEERAAGQRFFLTSAQFLCDSATEETWRALAETDSHAWSAPGVNGTVQNLPEFARTFGCGPSSPMVRPPDAVCSVW